MAATINQLTCVFISKGGKPECGLPAIGQCNMCKIHVLQTLMDEEKIEMERAKTLKQPVEGQPEKKPKKATKKDPLKPKKATKKDPLKPKKAMTAYMAFCAENRAQVIEENNGIKQPEIIKKLGEMWAEIKGDSEQIQPYLDLAAQDKIRFQTEMNHYSSDSENTNNNVGES